MGRVRQQCPWGHITGPAVVSAWCILALSKGKSIGISRIRTHIPSSLDSRTAKARRGPSRPDRELATKRPKIPGKAVSIENRRAFRPLGILIRGLNRPS
jgi:hypothetical protein